MKNMRTMYINDIDMEGNDDQNSKEEKRRG